jgi:GDP-L-fucose synthase
LTDRGAKVYVAGHRGMVGSAVVEALRRRGWSDLLLRSHAELELADGRAMEEFFAAHRPRHVVLAAARVGGILANNARPAEFIHQNLAIQTNVIHQAWRHGVDRLIFMGSSCIYPRDCPQPMREEHLLTGPLEPTNRPYAVAKIAGIEMLSAYHRQYGARFAALMPSNLYGPRDNYELETGHVLAALIRRMHEAREAGSPAVTLWGTGAPLREFVHASDAGEAAAHLLEMEQERYQLLFADPFTPFVNLGAGKDISIRELAGLVAGVVGYAGRIEWDPSKPDGTPRKLLDTSRMRALGFQPRVGLRQGLEMAYRSFLKERAGARPADTA